MRKLLCPEGYYCNIATGESLKTTFPCKINWFCPNGTADVSGVVGGTVIFNIKSVQADSDAINTYSSTGSICENCDHIKSRPGVGFVNCLACGADIFQPLPELEPNEVYEGRKLDPLRKPVEIWSNLQCPTGTASIWKSTKPDDCVQQNQVIAIVNVYKNKPAMTGFLDPATGEHTPIKWSEYDQLRNKRPEPGQPDYRSDPPYKFDMPLQMTDFASDGAGTRGVPTPAPTPDPSDPPPALVDFLAYKPGVESRPIPYTTDPPLAMWSMDIARLRFKFSSVNRLTKLNTKGGTGHYDLCIMSEYLRDIDRDCHTLPWFLLDNDHKELHYDFTLSLLAMARNFSFNVSVKLLHGSHLKYLSAFNEVLDIEILRPGRTKIGTRNMFQAVLDKELLQTGVYELPYNMPFAFASGAQFGEKELALDVVDFSANIKCKDAEPGVPCGVENSPDFPRIYNGQMQGTIFWSVYESSTLGMPWLPFFSNCEKFDSHIIVWDLFELQQDTPGCTRVDFAEVAPVVPMLFNFTKMELGYEAVADECFFTIECTYEDPLDPDQLQFSPFYNLPVPETSLFYLTRFPEAPENLEQPGFYDSYLGTDDLVEVAYISDNPDSTRTPYPRIIWFAVDYVQRTEDKVLRSAVMWLSDYDEDDNFRKYNLTLRYGPMDWFEMMDGFELDLDIYFGLYVVIGLAGCFTTLVVWAMLRAIVPKLTIPRFQLVECYEFMLWWPIQGVSIASVPIIVLAGLIQVMFLPIFDPFMYIGCDWMQTEMNDDTRDHCKDARVGACLFIAGFMMLWSGSKLIVPGLRQVEMNFLSELGTHELSEEGIPAPASEKQLVIDLPVRWKRMHTIWVSILVTFPLTVVLEYSYCNFFGNNTVYFIMAWSVMMMFTEGILSKSVRECLLSLPLGAACEVTLFVATMGADDFKDFCDGYFVELVFGVAERLILGSVVQFINSYVTAFIEFVKTRSWLWSIVMLVSGGRTQWGLAYNQVEAEDEDEDVMEDEDDAGVQIEEAMDEHIGGGAGCMSLILAPYLIVLIRVFSDETEIPNQYGIRLVDLTYYGLFGLAVMPFQVMMDIIMNHATEMAYGVRVYDYMIFAKWRWKNRTTRWLFDDPRFDDSISPSVQSANHLCFSPQFYFITSYYSWGIILVMMGLTSLLRKQHNPFGDPAFFYFIGQQYLINRVLDSIITWMTRQVLWKPKDNAPTKDFTRQVSIALRHKDAQIHLYEWRSRFFEKHKAWFLQTLPLIFTPRAVQRYRPRLRFLYQQILNLQPPHVFRKAGLPRDDTKPTKEDMDSDDVSEAAQRLEELEEDAPEVWMALPWPLCGPSGPQAVEDELPEGVSSHLSMNLMMAWYKVAQDRVEESKHAEQWKRTLVASTECKSCGVRADDASTMKADSLWGTAGPCLRVIETKNIYDLLDEYDGDDLDEWRHMLEDECWVTLCWRCANLQGFRPAPIMNKEAVDVSSDEDESSDGEAHRFVDYAQVNMSTTSREILLDWARRARQRIRHPELQIPL
jgi:hypothetical protein